MNKKHIEQIIVEAVKAYFQEEEINTSVELNTALSGQETEIDSVGLVTLMVGIEEKVEDDFGVPIILADEKAMSQKHSPFRTVGSLLDYIAMFLEEKLNE